MQMEENIMDRKNRWQRAALTAAIFTIALLSCSTAWSVTLLGPEVVLTDEGAGMGLGQPGVIGWDGSVLSGIGIEFTRITGIDTPLHAGFDDALGCFGCFLDFAVSATKTTEMGVDFWRIDPDGGTNEFSLEGEAGTIVDGEILSGEFTTGVAFELVAFSLGAEGADLKDEDLVEYFFGGDAPPFFVMSLTAQGAAAVPIGEFEDFEDFFELTNADITNFAAVPEPSSTALFLLGLTSLAAYRRRRS